MMHDLESLQPLIISICQQVEELLEHKRYEPASIAYDTILGIAVEFPNLLTNEQYKNLLKPCAKVFDYLIQRSVSCSKDLISHAICLSQRAGLKTHESSFRCLLSKTMLSNEPLSTPWPPFPSITKQHAKFDFEVYIQCLQQLNHAYRLVASSSEQQKSFEALTLHELDTTYRLQLEILSTFTEKNLAVIEKCWAGVESLGVRLFKAKELEKTEELYASFLQYCYEPLATSGNEARKESLNKFSQFMDLIIKIGQEFIMAGLSGHAMVLYHKILNLFLLSPRKQDQLLNNSFAPDRKTQLFFAVNWKIRLLCQAIYIAAKEPDVHLPIRPIFSETKWQNDRKKLQALRKHFKSHSKTKSVQAACTKSYQVFFGELLEETNKELFLPPGSEAAVGVGSYAYLGMLPYSDMEFIWLMRDGSDRSIQCARTRIKLLYYKVHSLDESDSRVSLGFHFDETAKTYKDPCLLGTPSQIADKLFNPDFFQDVESHLVLQFSICNFAHLIGDETLVEEFRNAVKHRLSGIEPHSGLKRYQWLVKQLLNANKHTFTYRKLDCETRNIKCDYINPLIQITLLIGFYHQISSVWCNKLLHYDDILSALAIKNLHPGFARYMQEQIEKLQGLYLNTQWHYNQAKMPVMLPHSDAKDSRITYKLSKEENDLLIKIEMHLLQPLFCCLDELLLNKVVDPAGEYVQAMLKTGDENKIQLAFVVYIDHLIYRQADYVSYRQFYRNLTEARRSTFLNCAKEQLEKAVVQQLLTPLQVSCILMAIQNYPNSDGFRPMQELRQKEWTSVLTQIVVPNLASSENSIRASVTGPLISQQFVHPSIMTYLQQNKWITQDGSFINKNLSQLLLPGNHLVIPVEIEINNRWLKFYIKVFPEFPLIEILVAYLYQLIIGWGTPMVELWRWQCGKNVYPVLISQAIPAKYKQYLQKTIEANPDILNQLNPKCMSQRFLMTLLTNPEDDKFNNNILEEFTIPTGMSDTRLVTVDNDRVFETPFRENRVRIKSVMYCLTQLEQQLEVEAREEFLELNPLKVVENLLSLIERDNAFYLSIFKEDEIIHFYGQKKILGGSSEHQRTLIMLPLKRQVFGELFAKIQFIQDCLAVHQTIALQELLKRLYPKLGAHYAQFSKLTNPLLRFDAATKGEYRRDYTTGEMYTSRIDMDAYLMSMRGQLPSKDRLKKAWLEDIQQARDELQQLSQLDYQLVLARNQLMLGEDQRFKNLPNVKAQEHVINEICFSVEPNSLAKPQWLLPKAFENRFISLLVGIAWRELKLNYLEKLDNTMLLAIVRNAPDLTVLRVKGCKQIQGSLLNELAKLCPYLEIIDLSETQVTHCQDRTLFNQMPIAFSHLKELYLSNCEKLQVIDIDAKKLEILETTNCSNLTLLKTQSQAMRRLVLTGCNTLPDFELPQIVANTVCINELTWSDSKNPIHILVSACPVFLAINWQITTRKRITELTDVVRKHQQNYPQISHVDRRKILNDMNEFLRDSIEVSEHLLHLFSNRSKISSTYVDADKKKMFEDEDKTFNKSLVRNVANLHIRSAAIIEKLMDIFNKKDEYLMYVISTLGTLDVSSKVLVTTFMRAKNEEDSYGLELSDDMLLEFLSNDQNIRYFLTLLPNGEKENYVRSHGFATINKAIKRHCLNSDFTLAMIRSAIRHSDNHVRVTAVEAIEVLSSNNPQLLELIVDLLEDDNHDVKNSVISALDHKRIITPTIFRKICNIFYKDYFSVHAALHYLLNTLPRAELNEILIEDTRHTDYRRSCAAALLLAKFNTYDTLPIEKIIIFAGETVCLMMFGDDYIEKILNHWQFIDQELATKKLLQLVDAYVHINRFHTITLLCSITPSKPEIIMKVLTVSGVILSEQYQDHLTVTFSDKYSPCADYIYTLASIIRKSGDDSILLTALSGYKDYPTFIALIMLIRALKNIRNEAIYKLVELLNDDNYATLYAFEALENLERLEPPLIHEISLALISKLNIPYLGLDIDIIRHIIKILSLLKITSKKIHSSLLWMVVKKRKEIGIMVADVLSKMALDDELIDKIIDSVFTNRYENTENAEHLLLGLPSSPKVNSALLKLFDKRQYYCSPKLIARLFERGLITDDIITFVSRDIKNYIASIGEYIKNYPTLIDSFVNKLQQSDSFFVHQAFEALRHAGRLTPEIIIKLRSLLKSSETYFHVQINTALFLYDIEDVDSEIIQALFRGATSNGWEFQIECLNKLSRMPRMSMSLSVSESFNVKLSIKNDPIITFRILFLSDKSLTDAMKIFYQFVNEHNKRNDAKIEQFIALLLSENAQSIGLLRFLLTQVSRPYQQIRTDEYFCFENSDEKSVISHHRSYFLDFLIQLFQARWTKLLSDIDNTLANASKQKLNKEVKEGNGNYSPLLFKPNHSPPQLLATITNKTTVTQSPLNGTGP